MRQAGETGLPALGKPRYGAEARHLRIRRSALPAEILAAWRVRQPAEAQRVQELLRGASELRQGDVGERHLLGWTQAFDAFTREQLSTKARRGGGSGR